jgi:hypothetical protein
MADPRLVEILRILDAQGVEFIVVGGMAAVIGGAPIVTRDVDVLVARSSANTPRVLAALSELDAIFRDDERRLRPNASHLAGPGHLLLQTRHGPLDLLGRIEENTTYDVVLDESYPGSRWIQRPRALLGTPVGGQAKAWARERPVNDAPNRGHAR